MKITKQTRRDVKRLFRLCLANGLLDEDRARQVVQLICQTTRRNRLAVLWFFQRLVRIHTALHTATVQSAAPLPPDLQASVQARLGQVYGPGLRISFAGAPELIGGMRIKVGSDVYDGSIRGGLAALEHSF